MSGGWPSFPGKLAPIKVVQSGQSRVNQIKQVQSNQHNHFNHQSTLLQSIVLNQANHSQSGQSQSVNQRQS